MSRRSYRPAGGARDFPRTARLNQLLREIVAEEIERIDDDRLGFLTVVDVTVDGDLRHATVWYTTLSVDESDPTVIEALAQHRPRIQAAIGRQARIRRTPELTFEPDAVVRQAARVEGILRDLAAGRDEDS
ncbi:MAG TPA: 30S ribosome-binding factor RbfA [Microthrixaceae bacterium]|nr:30S ribosome-binding factor RbfA [Microthrixaceae bacterium]